MDIPFGNRLHGKLENPSNHWWIFQQAMELIAGGYPP
jgi:hypothetical protein